MGIKSGQQETPGVLAKSADQTPYSGHSRWQCRMYSTSPCTLCGGLRLQSLAFAASGLHTGHKVLSALHLLRVQSHSMPGCQLHSLAHSLTDGRGCGGAGAGENGDQWTGQRERRAGNRRAGNDCSCPLQLNRWNINTPFMWSLTPPLDLSVAVHVLRYIIHF